MEYSQTPKTENKKKRLSRGFSLVILAIFALVIIASIIGYHYWPKQYATEYFIIVALLLLNILFLYGFVRHNSQRGNHRKNNSRY